jgi:4-amino-4-deoxy-L-arabinose transferase-like glycosyltransferase
MVLAALLRLLFLSQDSFWHDEIISVERALMDGEDFWDLIQGFPNMAFYYWVLRYWIVLGESEAVVRMLSVVAALAAVLGVYFLGARLFGPRVGVISALLLAINAFHIQYSQEARSYSLVILLVTLASLFLVRSVQRPYWGNWMAYAVLMALSVYTHYFGALVLAAHGVSLMFLPRRVIPWKRLMVSASVIAVALLMPVSSFAPLAFADSEEANQVGWVPGVSLNSVYRFTLDMTGNGSNCAGRVCGAPVDPANYIYLAYFIPVVAAGVISLRKWYITKASLESWKFALLWAWLVVPVLITLAVSFLSINAFVSRYLIISLPPLVVLAAVGIYEARSLFRFPVPLVSAGLLIMLELISARGVYAYYTEFEKEDWRGISNLIVSQWQPGDGVLFYVPWIQDDARQYLAKPGGTAVEVDSIVPQQEWTAFTSPTKAPDRDAIADYLPDDRQRVWLVLSHNRTPEHRRILTNEIREALSSKYRSVNSKEFYRISVHLYSNPVPGAFGGRWEQILRDTASCLGSPATLVGTNKNDTLVGTPGTDVIHALDGDDIIDGLGGSDIICGGAGNDAVQSGEGDDRVHSGEGDDIIKGGPGNDDLSGTKGNDQLSGDEGDDSLSGGSANDSLDGGEGKDTISGNDDDDNLRGGGGSDVLEGGKGDDVVDGGPDIDQCETSLEDSMLDCE